MRNIAPIVAAFLVSASHAFVPSPATSQASTNKLAVLHGRVKDQQCAVLAKLRVRIRYAGAPGPAAERTVTTDEGGNYTVELAPGAYDLCVERGPGGAACSHIDMPANGDKWMTTQLRDAAPDLSDLGNHAE